MEASAFKQRFMPHWRHLYWKAWRLTGNTQDAEDLVQEAFLKLWTKRESLGTIDNVEAYLTTLLTNMFRDQLRRRHLALADATRTTSWNGSRLATNRHKLDGSLGSCPGSRDAY